MWCARITQAALPYRPDEFSRGHKRAIRHGYRRKMRVFHRFRFSSATCILAQNDSIIELSKHYPANLGLGEVMADECLSSAGSAAGLLVFESAE